MWSHLVLEDTGGPESEGLCIKHSGERDREIERKRDRERRESVASEAPSGR